MRLLRLILPAAGTLLTALGLLALRPAEAVETASPTELESVLERCRANPVAFFAAPIPYYGMEDLVEGRTGNEWSPYDPVKTYGSFSQFPPDRMPEQTTKAVRAVNDMRESFSSAAIFVSIGGALITLGFVILGSGTDSPKQLGRGVLLVLFGLLMPLVITKAPSSLALCVPILLFGITGLVLDAKRKARAF